MYSTFQNKYGKSIIIQRTVLNSGGGTYKLKNEKGKIVLDKRAKEELERILLTFNIQLDNRKWTTIHPNSSNERSLSSAIALLNQDTAKTFLFKCNPKDLYSFFMRATQLEDCEQLYKQSHHRLYDARKDLEFKSGLIDKMKKTRDKWEEKHQRHKDIESRQGDVDKLRQELAWAGVNECRDKVR